MPAILVAATAVLLGITLAAERTGAAWRLWPKAAASAGYLGVAAAAGAAGTGYGRWVLAALVLGWVGDVALAVPRPAWFRAGLIAFLASHIAYLVAFGVLGLRAIAVIAAAAGLALPAGIVARWLLPSVPAGLRVPVTAYLVVITAMVAAACGAACAGGPWPILPAAVLFYASDLLVARDRFVTPAYANRLAGLPMYYAAQVLFALSTGMV